MTPTTTPTTTAADSPGPACRTDVIDAYVFRLPDPTRAAAAELLQVRRTREPMLATWQPVMGHIEHGERASDTLGRELTEELGLDLASSAVLGVWALEQVHGFFLPELDAIFFSPRFAVQVDTAWEPVLNEEHDAHRWVPIDHASRAFMWPGQLASIDELARFVLPPASPTRDRLRLARD